MAKKALNRSLTNASKAKCLNGKLDEKGNSFVKNILKKFIGDDSEFDIKIASRYKVFKDNTSNEVNGKTNQAQV